MLRQQEQLLCPLEQAQMGKLWWSVDQKVSASVPAQCSQQVQDAEAQTASDAESSGGSVCEGLKLLVEAASATSV